MSDRAYLTIVRYPSAFTSADRAAALSEALGIDAFHAAQRASHEPPLVLARVNAAEAPQIVARLKARRISAFALTQAYLKAHPRPFLVKRLVPALGCDEPMYMAEPWRGEPTGLRTADLFLIVRAAIDKVRTSIDIETTGGLRSGYSYGYGGPELPDPPTPLRSTERKTTHILDLWLRDGSRLRCNADRLSFDVLGQERGMTDLENTDRLALRLATEAPQAQIDTGFRGFRVPADLRRDLTSAFGTQTESDNAAAFDFYSIWTHTIHRGLARATPTDPA
ncbi:MAG TPA: hypothetical protein VD997_10830 [Phycisphaerales bacterium]|nr:hypothetical protein [Phycisphaerales bacterium]